ncbi:MAG: hypothetical protein QOE07_2884 [Acidimicrobiaceae bacterium]|nr:hypothetical protein [Acidimicrobiaceae bacterium]
MNTFLCHTSASRPVQAVAASVAGGKLGYEKGGRLGTANEATPRAAHQAE